MFSARAAELSVPAELSRSWTNHEPGNEHMQGGIRMDSSLFSYREGRGRLRTSGLLCMKTKEGTQARPLLRICEIIWRRLIGFLPSEARQEDGGRKLRKRDLIS